MTTSASINTGNQFVSNLQTRGQDDAGQVSGFPGRGQLHTPVQIVAAQGYGVTQFG